MLGDHEAIATIAVKELKAARRYYTDVLGLTLVEARGDEVLEYTAAGRKLFVYRSPFAGTNQATSVTWAVGNEIDAIVRELKSRGVQFEHYQLPNLTLEGDVHVGGPMREAWFKDPDGNIHSLVNG